MSNSDTSNITVSNISINSESTIINHDSIESNIVINKKTVTFNDNIQEIKIDNSNEDIESNTNDEDNIFKCYYCNKIFKTKNAYLNHKRMQVCYDTKDKTYCSVCDITFNSKAELDDHLLSEANTAQSPFWVFTGSSGGGSTVLDQQFLVMSSSNMNEAYGTSFRQADLEYFPAPSEYFPNGIEPKTTRFDNIEYNLEVLLQIGQSPVAYQEKFA